MYPGGVEEQSGASELLFELGRIFSGTAAGPPAERARNVWSWRGSVAGRGVGGGRQSAVACSTGQPGQVGGDEGRPARRCLPACLVEVPPSRPQVQSGSNGLTIRPAEAPTQAGSGSASPDLTRRASARQRFWSGLRSGKNLEAEQMADGVSLESGLIRWQVLNRECVANGGGDVVGAQPLLAAEVGSCKCGRRRRFLGA